MKNGNYLKGRRLIKHKKRRILWTRVRLIWFWEVSSPTTKSQKIPIVFELHTSFVLFLREFVFIVLIVRPAHIFCSQVQSPHTGKIFCHWITFLKFSLRYRDLVWEL